MAVDSSSTYATLIADLVHSREASSQESMLTDLEEARSWVNRRVEAVQPLRPTVGDEVQAVYAGSRLALKAALFLQLRLATTYEVRCGVGWGEVLTVEPEKAPMAQSGTGWWAARDAIDSAAALVKKPGWPRSIRTRVAGFPPATNAALNALLLYQDDLLSRMDQRDVRITIGLFEGESQKELARALDISQPAVSRRQLENGPACLLRAKQALEELKP